MTNREKIILGITAIVAVGAGVYYVNAQSSEAATSAQSAPVDFTTLITKVQLDLKESDLTDREETILSAATTPWSRDPLRQQPLLSLDSESSGAIPLPTYMGFINTGPQPIAVINGRDYRPGEAIQGGEFQLANVYPDHIELLRRGATDPVDVPLEKPQPPKISR